MLMSAKSFRLPDNVRPVNYDLFFEVDMDNFTFLGKESIELEIARPSSRIILNASGLEISGARLVQNGVSKKAKMRLDGKELLVLSFSRRVKGRAKLFLEFQGELNDSLLGFYRSKYVSGGREKYLATTQFEAPYARRCFPCFDEPELKATFDVTMKISKGLTAVSNMPVKEETEEGGRKTVKFHRTPKMSSYLLYLGVGEFEFLEDNLRKTAIRIVTVPGKKEQGKLAMDLTKKFLDYFEKYSGIAYPLPKLDMIALPDFASGAMENWGAITFREVYLLHDDKMTSTAVRKVIAMIIAHELWHQWSGNLVTMRWWSDLWLNESFATYMAYKAVDALFPEWNMWEDFISDETSRAFEDDSLKTTHPIETAVGNPHEIEELFDSISYSKGGSILRMLDSYLGEEAFRKGVSSYLLRNKYGSAASEDLWDSLSGASSKPVKEMTVSWIRQAGYPLVETSVRNNELVLRQRRFAFRHRDNAKWLIPLTIKLDGIAITELLEKAEKRIKMRQNGWFKVNYGQSGFYRVKYPEENLSKLKVLVSEKKLPAPERWGVQNDLFKLCVNGEISIGEYLDFIKAFGNEDDYLVLGSICASMRSIYFMFCQENFWPEIWPGFKNHFSEAPRKILDKLGWEPSKGESQKDALLRDLCFKYLAFIEDPEAVKKGLKKFEAFTKSREMHPDIKPSVLYTAAIAGDESTYEKIKSLYLGTHSPEEKRMFLGALGQFRSPVIVEKYLDFSLTSGVRVQDLPVVFSSAASNPHSRSVFSRWVAKNWKILKGYEKTGKLFLTLVESFVSSCASRSTEKELKAFFRTHPIKYKTTLKRSFEKVRRNIAWLERNRAALRQYFS